MQHFARYNLIITVRKGVRGSGFSQGIAALTVVPRTNQNDDFVALALAGEAVFFERCQRNKIRAFWCVRGELNLPRGEGQSYLLLWWMAFFFW